MSNNFDTHYTESDSKIGKCREAAQIFCLERATIAEWLRKREKHPVNVFLEKQVSKANGPKGGASENKNYEVNPTPTKTDSSGNFGIGLRNMCILLFSTQSANKGKLYEKN